MVPLLNLCIAHHFGPFQSKVRRLAVAHIESFMSCLLQKEEKELPYAVNVTLTSTLLRKKEVRIASYPCGFQRHSKIKLK
jgi:hypothetical protein